MENGRLIYRTPDIKDIASQFVDLARTHNWNDGKIEFLKDEEEILFKIVRAAGFCVRGVELGRLTIQDKFDVEGENGERKRVNILCPFKVKDLEGDDYIFATGWLDCILRLAVYGGMKRVEKESREKLIKAVSMEIEKSVPLEPIMFTKDGDLLVEYPLQPYTSGDFPYFVEEHVKDKNVLGPCVGLHDSCGGWIDFKKSSSICNEIVCRKCRKKAVFSNEIKTFGELRRQLELTLAFRQCVRDNNI